MAAESYGGPPSPSRAVNSPRSPHQSPMEALAEEMGVSVVSRALARSLLGLTLDAFTIVVNQHLEPESRESTIAHELGHIAVRRGCYIPASPADEESYAEAYGRTLRTRHGS